MIIKQTLKQIEDYIPLADLKVDHFYEVCSRAISHGHGVAKYIGDDLPIYKDRKYVFLTPSYSFGKTYLEHELHWDADDHCGTVKPIRELISCRVSDDKLLYCLHAMSKIIGNADREADSIDFVQQGYAEGWLFDKK